MASARLTYVKHNCFPIFSAAQLSKISHFPVQIFASVANPLSYTCLWCSKTSRTARKFISPLWHANQDTPARKALRQQQMKSLQQTRYHTPLTQPRVRQEVFELNPDNSSVKQQLQFCEESDNDEQNDAGMDVNA